MPLNILQDLRRAVALEKPCTYFDLLDFLTTATAFSEFIPSYVENSTPLYRKIIRAESFFTFDDEDMIKFTNLKIELVKVYLSILQESEN